MRPLRSLSLTAAVLAVLPLTAHAEKLPRPSVDYAVDGTMTSGKGSNPATMRHSNGRMRLDTDADGHPTAVYIDIATRTVTVVAERMGQKVAMTIDPERAGEAMNFMDRDAKRVGEAQVAGERCDEFEFDTGRGHVVRTCITRDGVSLRARDMSRGRVVWEASRVTRAPQSADLFVVPRDAIPMQLPKMK